MEQLSFLEKEIPYVLMSLREIYLNEMLSGEKSNEYRSRYPLAKTNAFIYISKTKKAISAYIEFGLPVYDEKRKLYAIPIEKLQLLKNSITLEELKCIFPKFSVPESWYYLKEDKQELLNLLLRLRDE